MELALVRHVRRSLPSRTLKDLAQEIGFVDDDFEGYKRLLELNVVAPRLSDMRLLEDTHAWGQVYAYMHTYIRTYIHTYIHTHMHTHTRAYE